MRFLIIYRRYVIWLRDFFKVFKKEKITESQKEKLDFEIGAYLNADGSIKALYPERLEALRVKTDLL